MTCRMLPLLSPLCRTQEPAHNRTFFFRNKLTQTMPEKTNSQDPFIRDEFTQLINQDSLEHFWGDTIVLDSDLQDDTEILGNDDGDECGDVESDLKERPASALNDAPGHETLDDAHAADPNRDVPEALEFDTLKCDSDASTECENTAFAETAVESPSSHPERRNEGVTPDAGYHERSKQGLHDIDSCKIKGDNLFLNNMGKMDLRVQGNDKNSLHMSASGSRAKSIGSVRAASLRASGLRAARQKAIGGLFGKSGTKNDTIATTKQNSRAVNDELGTLKFTGTEYVHDTSEAGDISLIQTPEKTAIFSDNRYVCSPCLSTSRPKPKANGAGELKPLSRQLNSQKARKLIFDYEDKSPTFSNNKPENGEGGLESFSFEKDPVLNRIILQQQNSLPSGVHAVSTNLTYVESQEPGEESQMNAFNVVDKLICLDSTCTPQKPTRNVEPEPSVIEGHQGTSGLKSLAQAAQMKVIHDKTNVYDWIDSQPDEGSPFAVKEIHDKNIYHGNQLEAFKLTTLKKKKLKSGKKGQHGMDRKNLEGNLQRKSATSDGAVLCSSTVMPTIVPNSEHHSPDEDGKIHAFTERLKNRSRIQLPSCGKDSDTYSKKPGSRKRVVDKSMHLPAETVQKCQRTDAAMAIDRKERTLPDNVDGHKESEFGSIIQTDKDILLTKNAKPVSKTSRKRNLSIGEARKDLKRSKMEQLKSASKLKGTVNGKSMEENKVNLRKGPQTRSKAQNAKGKLRNSIASGGKSSPKVTRKRRTVQKSHQQTDVTSTTEQHSRFDANNEVDEGGERKVKNSSITANKFADSIFQNDGQEDNAIGNSGMQMCKEEKPPIIHKGKKKSSFKCSDELLKHQKLQTKSSLSNTRSLLSDALKNTHIDVPIPKGLRNGRQKGSKNGTKTGVHFEFKEEVKGKKINSLNKKILAAHASEVKLTTRGDEVNSLSQSVSNSDNSMSLEERRQKRNPSSVQVLFSHSLPEEITKHQKKILAKLGGNLATSVTSCTHFISNSFVRTRNMLISMAAGKVIATTHWLECCSQAHYFVDEKNYILQDNKKEKELGFSMHSSLAAARRKPLLKGIYIVVTPNATPDHEALKEIIESAGGQIVQRDSDFLKSDACKEERLVIGSDKDYEYSLEFLEKGLKVYTTELIFHGIVTQNLDFSRNQIFSGSIRRSTRSGRKSKVSYKC